MQKLSNGITLYHGSYCKVSIPSLAMCARYKDFGQGFYLTTSLEQAKNFAKLSTRKAKSNEFVPKHQNYGVVSKYQFIEIEEEKLNMHIFDSADAQWLHCVVGHRKKNTFSAIVNQLENYDIIGGKIADDSTNATITAYMSGTFGIIGTDSADEICIKLLIPERLTDQFCFRTKSSLEHLKYMEEEKVWL